MTWYSWSYLTLLKVRKLYLKVGNTSFTKTNVECGSLLELARNINKHESC